MKHCLLILSICLMASLSWGQYGGSIVPSSTTIQAAGGIVSGQTNATLGSVTLSTNGIDGGGKPIVNVATVVDPTPLSGVSNTIALGSVDNDYVWGLTNDSIVVFSPCSTTKQKTARLGVQRNGFTFTISALNCITNGLGNVSLCTNLSYTGWETYVIDQEYAGTNTPLIGVIQIR